MFPTNPASYDQFGGPKEDAVPVVDPTTDRSSDEVNPAFQAIAQMTQTTPQAIVQWTASASSSVVPSFHRALWGSSLAVIPTVTNVSAGVWTVTFPASFTDELGNSVPVNLKAAIASYGATAGFISAQLASANSFTVRTVSLAGTANTMSGSMLQVVAF